jgi:hypothetical protein
MASLGAVARKRIPSSTGCAFERVRMRGTALSGSRLTVPAQADSPGRATQTVPAARRVAREAMIERCHLRFR